MPYSVHATDLREGLGVYRVDQPDQPGSVVSWSLGRSPGETTVVVKWLGNPSSPTLLSGLKHFDRFVSDLRAEADRYCQLSDELRHVTAAATAQPVSGARRDCLNCAHKDTHIADPPCSTCKPVTGDARNWARGEGSWVGE